MTDTEFARAREILGTMKQQRESFSDRIHRDHPRFEGLTPREVVERMSFNSRSSPFEAKSEPPSGAPPPPPLNSVEEDPLLSYQHGDARYTPTRGTRAAPLPEITHFDDEPDPRWYYRYGFRGDVSVRPNTGETNSYDYAIFGLALHELLENLRLANILSATASILVLLTTWLFQAITLQWTSLILQGYLAVLSLFLLLAECMTLFKVPQIDSFVRKNLGILYQPFGKASYIFFLATLCWGIGGLMEIVIGWAYFISAGILLYAIIIYPELRSSEDELTDREKATIVPPHAQSWSYYSSSFSSMVGEKASLLNSRVRQQSI